MNRLPAEIIFQIVDSASLKPAEKVNFARTSRKTWEILRNECYQSFWVRYPLKVKDGASREVKRAYQRDMSRLIALESYGHAITTLKMQLHRTIGTKGQGIGIDFDDINQVLSTCENLKFLGLSTGNERQPCAPLDMLNIIAIAVRRSIKLEHLQIYAKFTRTLESRSAVSLQAFRDMGPIYSRLKKLDVAYYLEWNCNLENMLDALVEVLGESTETITEFSLDATAKGSTEEWERKATYTLGTTLIDWPFPNLRHLTVQNFPHNPYLMSQTLKMDFGTISEVTIVQAAAQGRYQYRVQKLIDRMREFTSMEELTVLLGGPTDILMLRDAIMPIATALPRLTWIETRKRPDPETPGSSPRSQADDQHFDGKYELIREAGKLNVLVLVDDD